MKSLPISATALCAASVLAAPAFAEPFTMNGATYDVIHITGTGPDQALLEVDFGTAALPQPFLFAFQWDPATITSPSGRTMLSALQSDASGLTFTDTYYASFDSYLLNSLWCGTHQPPDNYPDSFWLWFSSNNGAAWTQPDVGYDKTAITNGGFFAWAWQNSDPNFPTYPFPPLPPSHFPAAISPVPEPAALLLFLPMTLLLLRRRS
jgi:hypothetical protein